MLAWIASAFSITGVLLNAKRNIWCWPVWLVSNALWTYLSIVKTDWPQLVLWLFFAVGNVYGWNCWKRASYSWWK